VTQQTKDKLVLLREHFEMHGKKKNNKIYSAPFCGAMQQVFFLIKQLPLNKSLFFTNSILLTIEKNLKYTPQVILLFVTECVPNITELDFI
jgi:hypothetical protein